MRYLFPLIIIILVLSCTPNGIQPLPKSSLLGKHAKTNFPCVVKSPKGYELFLTPKNQQNNKYIQEVQNKFTQNQQNKSKNRKWVWVYYNIVGLLGISYWIYKKPAILTKFLHRFRIPKKF